MKATKLYGTNTSMTFDLSTKERCYVSQMQVKSKICYTSMQKHNC